MVEALPQHDHCLACDDPIEVGERFCSDKCRLEHEAELRKERNRNILFFSVVIVLFVVIMLGYYMS
jgi:predicted nucleic acid-binding Zn ribbon protein